MIPPLRNAAESSPRGSRIVRAFALLVAVLVLVTATVASPAALAQEDGSGGGEQSPEAPAPDSADDGGSTSGEGSSEGGEDSASGEEEGSGEEESSNIADETIEKPPGIGGIGIDILKAIVGYVWDWSFTWFGDRVGQGLIGAMLILPDPTGSSDLGGIYDSVMKLLSPVLLVGVLVMSLLMMLKAHNSGISYAGLNFLPRMLGIAIVLGALPFLMGELSTLGQDLTISLMPNGEEIATAGKEMLKAILGQLVVGNIMNLILALVGTYVLMVVAVVTFFKNIFFILLFIAAPFPLLASLIPGLSNFAYSWAKAVLVCAAIPAMWAAELWLGTRLLVDPRMVFGEGADALGFITNGMFTSIIAIIIMWIMYKTPFKVLSWAFVSYDPDRGGGIGSFGKWMALSAGKQALGQVAGALKGGGDSGADVLAGGSGGGKEYGKPRHTETVKETTRWQEDSAGNVSNQNTQYERTRTMSMDHDPDTVNATPPPDHGPTSSGSTPWAQPGRSGPQSELGGGSAPTVVEDADGNVKFFVAPNPQPFRPRNDKEGDE